MAPLSGRQQRALARAPPSQRAKLQRLYESQTRGRNGHHGQNRNNQSASRSRADLVLAPGVGRVPSRPFGSIRGEGLKCWDALHPSHAPLPRAIGPYAVVRTTRIFSNNHRHNVFGTAVDLNGSWSNTVCWSSVNGANAINGAANTYRTGENLPGSNVGDNSTFTVVPSAFSVQVMNQNPLQTTAGLVYAAVCPTQLSLIDNTRTWDTFESQFVAYMKPRLMSMPKLAIKGVQMNSYPLNMAAISNFEAMANHGDHAMTWESTTGDAGNAQYLTGWAPIVVVNTGSNSLTFAVTVEYRVRFDISNPAVASHVSHPCTPDKVWDNMTRSAAALGNGVMEIAEGVANMGHAGAVVGALT